MRFKTIQPDNPILRAEINYQQRTLPRWLLWFDRFGVIVLALVISLVLLCFPVNGYRYGNWLRPEILNVMAPALWLSLLATIFRCILTGFRATHHHNVWKQRDILALTGITKRQVLVGKFWSVLYQLRGWMVALGIVKLTVFVFLTINLMVYCYKSPFDDITRDLAFYSRGATPLVDVVLMKLNYSLPQLPNLGRIALTGIHIVIISILEIMTSSAIGMVGGLVPQKILGLGVAIFLRLSTVISFTFFPDYPYAGGFIFWRWYEYTWFSLADGGSTAILRSGLIYRGALDVNQITWTGVLAFWAAIMMYIAYIVFAFLVSQYLLRRQGILSASSK